MIRVERSIEPTILQNSKNSWIKSYLKAIRRVIVSPTQTNVRLKKIAENKYNNKFVKDALKNMFNGKCAYCESHVTHVGYPHIEHYRPKVKYPRLCFEWNNLLLGCSICNGASYKGVQFPTTRDSGPYINPVTEDPNDFFDFIFDAQTGVSIVKPKKRRGATTETQLGLNRADLLKHRNQVIMNLAFIADRARKGDIEAILLLLDNTNGDKEYSAFARAFCRKIKLF